MKIYLNQFLKIPFSDEPIQFGAAPQLVSDIFKKINGSYTPQSWWEIAGKIFGVPGTAQLKKSIKAVDGIDGGYTVTTNKGKKIKIKITDTVDKVRALLLGMYETKTAEQARQGKYRNPKTKLKPRAN